MSEMMNNPAQLIGLLIDIAVIAGLFALWLIWHQNSTRQKKLEALLGETARQLDEATQHLNQATVMIELLKTREEKMQQSKEQPTTKAARHSMPETTQQASASAPLPPENSTQATMVLRMHREGEQAEAIADRLDIPLAQVKLLLKLYASKTAA